MARLLVVDDSPSVGLIIRRLGERAGHEVAAVGSAESARDCLEQVAPDLLMLDVHLPGMSGLEFCQQLRHDAGGKHWPVAMLCHWQRQKDIAAGWRVGADFVLTKDMMAEPSVWQERVDEVLAFQAGRRPDHALRWSGSWDAKTLVHRFNGSLRAEPTRQLSEDLLDAVLGLACSPFYQGPLSTGLNEGMFQGVSREAIDRMLESFAQQLVRIMGNDAARQWVAAWEAAEAK